MRTVQSHVMIRVHCCVLVVGGVVAVRAWLRRCQPEDETRTSSVMLLIKYHQTVTPAALPLFPFLFYFFHNRILRRIAFAPLPSKSHIRAIGRGPFRRRFVAVRVKPRRPCPPVLACREQVLKLPAAA